jgi:signal transduction histidine kinase
MATGIARRLPLHLQLALALMANSLLTALVLGTALSVILGGYYTRAEDQYLRAAARRAVNELGRPGVAESGLLAAARSAAISTQTRVKYYDAKGRLLADSGSPRNLNPAVALQTPGSSAVASTGPPSVLGGSVPPTAPVGGTQAPGGPAGGPAPPGQAPSEGVPLPNPGGPGMFGGPGSNEPPSSRTLRLPVAGVGSSLSAYVVVGEAPASGRSMLIAALEGWLLSALVALCLAAAFGFLVSRRFSRPIVRLTLATDRMAEGDLSVRAEESGEDEIGRLSQSFNLMAQRTQAGMVALQRFVADAAHELRTPLTALQVDLHLARTDAGSEEERKRLSQASRQARRLEGLADSLLLLSRLDAGEAIHRGRVDLGALVALCADGVASRAEQAGARLEVAVLPDGGPVIESDASKLAVAIDNLLDNALKFTSEDDVVRVGAILEGSTALVWVEDTGIGVPEADRDAIFGRFSRGHNVSAFPGSGLGLAVVRATAELLGGSAILADSASGARFEIRVPVG